MQQDFKQLQPLLQIQQSSQELETQLLQLETARAELTVAKEEWQQLQSDGGEFEEATEEDKEEEQRTAENICDGGGGEGGSRTTDVVEARKGFTSWISPAEASDSLDSDACSVHRALNRLPARAGGEGKGMGGNGGGGAVSQVDSQVDSEYMRKVENVRQNSKAMRDSVQQLMFKHIQKQSELMKIVEKQQLTETKLTQILEEKESEMIKNLEEQQLTESKLTEIIADQQEEVEIWRKTASALRGTIKI